MTDLGEVFQGLIDAGEAKPASELPPPLATEVRVVEMPSLVYKGDPVRMFDRQQANALSDVAADCRRCNALHIDILVAGTTPSATISVEGASERGALYLPLPRPAVLGDVSANASFDVIVGTAWAKVRVANISGTGASFTVIATPFIAPDQTRDHPSIYNATGTGAIALSTTMARKFRLTSVTCHFSAAPTTSEDFTVTLNAAEGAAYDTVLVRKDPSAGAVVDIVYIPDGYGLILGAGDEIDVAYTNTDGRTYGLRIACEAV